MTTVTREETAGLGWSRKGGLRAWLKEEVIRLAVLGSRVPGLLVLLVASFWAAVGSSTYLGKVFVTGGGVMEPTGSSSEWAGMTGLSAVGLVLITRPSRWFRSVDLVGLFGAGWALGWTVLFSWFFYSLEFWDPERRCQYRSCWPGACQAILVAAPLGVACLLVVAMATFGCRRSWHVRALFPVGAYVALTVVQVGTWERFVLPLFTSPPPG